METFSDVVRSRSIGCLSGLLLVALPFVGGTLSNDARKLLLDPGGWEYITLSDSQNGFPTTHTCFDAIASKNAVKTGLTGRTIVLPAEDAELYEKHVERFRRDFNPVTDRERELVQSLADTQWRLNRIPGLEMGIYIRGRALYAELFLEIDDPQMRNLCIDSHTQAVHTRDLNNLSIQESRLRRNYAKDLAELKTLQSERDKSSIGAMSEAIGTPAPVRNGFVFSTGANASFDVGSETEPGSVSDPKLDPIPTRITPCPENVY